METHPIEVEQPNKGKRAWTLIIPPGYYTVDDFCEFFNKYAFAATGGRFRGSIRHNKNTHRLYFYLKPGEMIRVREARLRKLMGMKPKTIENKTQAPLVRGQGDTSFFNANLKHMFAYTNIIDSNVIGNTFAPILRVVKIVRAGENGESGHASYSDGQYFKINRQVISYVEIELRDSLGAPIQFPKGEVFAILHFRRHKKRV